MNPLQPPMTGAQLILPHHPPDSFNVFHCCRATKDGCLQIAFGCWLSSITIIKTNPSEITFPVHSHVFLAMCDGHVVVFLFRDEIAAKIHVIAGFIQVRHTNGWSFDDRILNRASPHT